MDVVIQQLRSSLPDDVVVVVEQHLQWLEHGDFAATFSSTEARALLNLQSSSLNDALWTDRLFEHLGTLIANRTNDAQQTIYFCIGYAALFAFIQTSITGPPLPFAASKLLLPPELITDGRALRKLRLDLLGNLTTDGIAAYRLIPNIELLALADAILAHPAILKNVSAARWARLRLNFVHQRLLSEVSSTLQGLIYDDLSLLADEVLGIQGAKASANKRSQFLLERAAIHLYHGFDKLAQTDIEQARMERRFEYQLTGRLGKRTKFQQHDISQLVVLAKSADTATDKDDAKLARSALNQKTIDVTAQPENLDLNDDTLLERIAFTERSAEEASKDPQELPTVLAALDPANQPQLDPLDSVILLAFASSITNTSPEHGLTREELLPYANRVLDGGSSNWQIYTQALLVRSRVEGYKSRTVERGLLQLQALVDQVIAETTDIAGSNGTSSSDEPASSTFLPRPKKSESASVVERLSYVFQLASPTRWNLEAELASRWVSLGGLRSALEIYERLEMWAEAALCWAATENEDKARKIVRRQLFHRTDQDTTADVDEQEKWEGPVRDPAPLDAPRLYCILGDMDQSIEMYETAWNVSKQRYARAQRSIGRHYFAARDYEKAAEAYSKSLKVNRLNQQSWFALGCSLIELEQYGKAVEAFSRCVQLDDTDAEGWSNLAASLLRADPGDDLVAQHTLDTLHDDLGGDLAVKTPIDLVQRNRVNALKAFQRAASIKHDSYRIWQNVLVTAASLMPPDYVSILSAQKRVIDLRGGVDGEKCIDVEILDGLLQHIISSSDSYDASKPGVVRMTVRFVDESVVPLITASATLWRLVSKLALWRQKPGAALEAEEKAWRAIMTQPGWESESEKHWDEVVEATIRLCDSYESLGPRERTEGLAAGSNTLVARDWKFKARSAIRGILNKGQDCWQDTSGWYRLQDAQQQLKG